MEPLQTDLHLTSDDLINILLSVNIRIRSWVITKTPFKAIPSTVKHALQVAVNAALYRLLAECHLLP